MPDVLDADTETVATTLRIDVHAWRAAVDRNDLDAAEAWMSGSFLDGAIRSWPAI